VVINDRSVDNTENILAEAYDDSRETHPEFHVLQGKPLPEGWLGKPYALQQGATFSTAEWLLLTDADIHFEATALQRAMLFCETHQLDHLAVFPELTHGSPFLNSLYGTFWCLFSFFHQPWSVSSQKSKAFMGVGAFNLVRRSSLVAIGAFECVAHCPAEDMMLGKALKEQGFKQQVLFGTEMVAVAWYPSAVAFLLGLRKNVFPMLDYQIFWVIAGVLGVFIALIWPFVGLFVAPKSNFWLHEGVHLLQLLVLWEAYRLNTLWLRLPFNSALGTPVAAACFSWVMIDSCFRTLSQGGIYWRGTFYPLSELRSKTKKESR
jgi:glycosyltransferase involved in cell wall biosynthesis